MRIQNAPSDPTKSIRPGAVAPAGIYVVVHREPAHTTPHEVTISAPMILPECNDCMGVHFSRRCSSPVPVGDCDFFQPRLSAALEPLPPRCSNTCPEPETPASTSRAHGFAAFPTEGTDGARLPPNGLQPGDPFWVPQARGPTSALPVPGSDAGSSGGNDTGDSPPAGRGGTPTLEVSQQKGPIFGYLARFHSGGVQSPMAAAGYPGLVSADGSDLFAPLAVLPSQLARTVLDTGERSCCARSWPTPSMTCADRHAVVPPRSTGSRRPTPAPSPCNSSAMR
jgi:hypothetical protein